MPESVPQTDLKDVNKIFPEIRQITETFYALQKLRIQASNRVSAYVRMGLEEGKAKGMHSWVDERLHSLEEELGRLLAKKVDSFKIWNEWLVNIKGMGPTLACSLVAWIGDIGRFSNPSKLRRYCGMAVINGEAEHRIKGEKIHYSPVLKTTCWKIASQFVRQGDYYRKIYDEAKKKIKEKFPNQVDTGKKKKDGSPLIKYTDGHIHAMAMRKTVQVFLTDLWIKWRKLEGLPIMKPYAIDILGHSGYKDPEEYLKANGNL